MSVSRAGSSIVRRSKPATALSQLRRCSWRTEAWKSAVSWVKRLSSKSGRHAATRTAAAAKVRILEDTGISGMLHWARREVLPGARKAHKQNNLGCLALDWEVLYP